MAIERQVITDQYAIYHGDSCEWLPSVPSLSVGLVLHSPPFALETGAALYRYSSSVRDLSNARTYEEFFEHYWFIVEQIYRVLKPGRICAVHCTDIPKLGANICGYSDFPGHIIKLYEDCGFEYLPRICIWKEPLTVRNRTMAKSLYHSQIVEDSTLTNVAAGDYLIPFRKRGVNPEPVTHPTGFDRYIGERQMPAELLEFRGWAGNQIENRYSHWIWRQYASCVWDDINLSRVLPYEESKDADDERHQHPLQLDVCERAVVMWSNPGDVVMSPFGGVFSEPYSAVINGRKGLGCELKRSYFAQGVKNMEMSLLPQDRRTERTINFDADEQDPEVSTQLEN